MTLLGRRHSHHLLHRVLEEHSDSGQVTPGRHSGAVTGLSSAGAAGRWFSAMDREGWKAEPQPKVTGFLRP